MYPRCRALPLDSATQVFLHDSKVVQFFHHHLLFRSEHKNCLRQSSWCQALPLGVPFSRALPLDLETYLPADQLGVPWVSSTATRSCHSSLLSSFHSILRPICLPINLVYPGCQALPLDPVTQVFCPTAFILCDRSRRSKKVILRPICLPINLVYPGCRALPLDPVTQV